VCEVATGWKESVSRAHAVSAYTSTRLPGLDKALEHSMSATHTSPSRNVTNADVSLHTPARCRVNTAFRTSTSWLSVSHSARSIECDPMSLIDHPPLVSGELRQAEGAVSADSPKYGNFQ
jgi:hypothetical protein